MTKLSAATLADLDPAISVPTYDRRLRNEGAGVAGIGIVHFGVGAFHRAHQAVYLDQLLTAGEKGWGICGVGVLRRDTAIRDVLNSQDGLYALVTVDPTGEATTQIIGSHLAHLHAPDDPQAVVDLLTDPAIRIVSLTITEGGYGINDVTGAFEPSDTETVDDLQNLTIEPGAGTVSPRSVLGFIVAGLAARRAAGTPPFTVMSCDNIQHNGQVTKKAVTSFAAAVDARLGTDHAAWIGTNVAFPNSMVDRITPATTPHVIGAVQFQGVDDRWPVRSEAFSQWVLEDRFSAGRPPFESVGVQIVADVAPYELMKLRLLNASHQVMSYLAILDDMTYVHEVCRDPAFTAFLLGYMREEAMPTLEPVPGINVADYCHQLIERFSSEAIRDTLARQAVDGSDRIPKFVLPVISRQLELGGDIRRAALTLAAWSRHLTGATDSGKLILPDDRRLDTLRAAAIQDAQEPGAFLDQPDIFGDLSRNPRLRAAYVAARAALVDGGARAAVTALT